MATSTIALGLTDLFDGAIHAHSPTENAKLPAENVSTQLPSQPFEGGGFEINALNQYIDIDEGAGEVVVTLTVGSYTGEALEVQLEADLAASALTHTYTVGWDVSSGQWSIADLTGSFEILTKTGTHGSDNADDGVYNELGWLTVADTGFGTSHLADELRYSTHHWLVFDLGSAKAVDAVLAYLESSDDANASFDDLRVFAHTSDAGDLRRYWETTALVTDWTASARPTSGFNRVQVAHPTTGKVTKRWWMLSWRHFDEVEYHRIGLCKSVRDASASRHGHDRSAARASPVRPLAESLDLEPVPDELHGRMADVA